MEPNKLESQFREKLSYREINPSGAAWDRLEAMLTVAEKPKRNYTFWYVAASIVGFLFVGTVFFNQKENPISIDKNEEQPVLRQSSGGLVSALVSYFEKTGTSASKFNEHIWVGSVDFSPQEWNHVSDQSKTSDFTVEPIFIDDENIQQLNLNELRENIGYVPQEVFLFSDSLKIQADK